MRSLVFGPGDLYRTDLGNMVAACVLDQPIDGLDDGKIVLMADTRRSVWISSYEDYPPVASCSTTHPGPRRGQAETLDGIEAGRWREVYLETNDNDYSDWLIEVQLELTGNDES